MDKVLCTLVHDSANRIESQIIIISEVEGKGNGVGWCFPIQRQANDWRST